MITVAIQNETPQAAAHLFGPRPDGETFSTLDITTPTVKVTIYTSDPAVLMQIAQSAANLSHQLRKQLAADAAAAAILTEQADFPPMAEWAQQEVPPHDDDTVPLAAEAEASAPATMPM
jgi:hypothetical protein